LPAPPKTAALDASGTFPASARTNEVFFGFGNPRRAKTRRAAFFHWAYLNPYGEKTQARRNVFKN
jgi:hypothetical protein